MREHWWTIVWLMIIPVLGLGLAQAIPEANVLRFSDKSASTPLSQAVFAPTKPDAPAMPAYDWLEEHGWHQVWPKLFFGKRLDLVFDGPLAQRYLRIDADDAYAVWTRRMTVDPHRFPILEITWAIERFPQNASLSVYGRNDRPIAVIVSFGPKVPSGILRPDVPRGLAFFWGETEQVGKEYTCITPRRGPQDERLQCTYPHIKYIALRSDDAKTVHTDRVNLVELFRRDFPEYWAQHGQAPAVTAVSFEARTTRTDSVSIARLYGIAFRAAGPSEQTNALPLRGGL
jgi:hypothetical protein